MILNWLPILLTSTLLYTIISAQTQVSENENSPQKYVVLLKFYLNEEKLPDIVGDILNTTESNITAVDFIQLIKLNNITLEDTLAIVNYYNVTTDNAFSADNLEKILVLNDLKFKEFYEEFQRTLNFSNALPNILNVLNITEAPFLLATLTGSDNIYNILRSGNYSEENVEEAIRLTGKTKSEVFETAKAIILNKAVKLESANYILNYLRNQGLNHYRYLELWNVLNITKEDVYGVESLKNILLNQINNLNENPTIGTVVSNSTIVIHKKMYDQFTGIDSNKYTRKANNLIVSEFKKNIAANVVELQLKTMTLDFIELSSDELPNNCCYITIINDTVTSEVVSVQHINSNEVSVVNAENLTFILGSPLVCNNALYGLANSKQDAQIKFDTIFVKYVEPPTPIVPTLPIPSNACKFYISIAIILTAVIIAV